VHDWLAYLKYGYGRCVAQLSVDIRSGKIEREYADRLRGLRESFFPWRYAGIIIEETLDRIDYDLPKLHRAMHAFANRELFGWYDKDPMGMPKLKEA
jgi:hypothetical protein